PFHAWLPNAYGNATASSSAMLSSIVSKGYIFLLVKIIYRVTGAEVFAGSGIINVLFVFGIIGMVLGSLDAVRQKNLRRMVAYSSVAQIGYIFMGIGLGSAAGAGAGLYHIFAHAAAKSLVFVAAFGLIKVSAGNADIQGLRGAGFRNKAAGVGFVAGSLSMVGIPGFGG
ncbi:sodium:proton antiporter, partial [Romboutsia ilealis]|nr:sodium:proton antiporter [Romboutsia ilealis]